MEIEVNDNNFETEVLKSNIPVLVDFWADWCMPCKMVAPVIKEIAEEYSGKIKVCKLNVDNSPVTAANYNVMSIPTLAIFKNGKIADTIVGFVPKERIKAAIDKNLL